jgi:hypothetical protein
MRSRARKSGRRIVKRIEAADSTVGNGYDETLQLKTNPNTLGG